MFSLSSPSSLLKLPNQGSSIYDYIVEFKGYHHFKSIELLLPSNFNNLANVIVDA